MEIETIIHQLKSASDPKRKEASKTMFPTKMEYLGVRNPDMKLLITKWWVELKKLQHEELIFFAKKLVKTKIFECNYVAFELLWKNKNALNMLTLKDIEILGANLDNWVTTDTFSVIVSGWAWRNNQITDKDILNWLKSDNLWWRRAAVVSTVGMNLKSRGGKGDTKRTLMVCEKVVNDREDMIVKAVSWALRELSKSDNTAVENFMNKYDSVLAGRVRREVYSKLNTGRKNG